MNPKYRAWDIKRNKMFSAEEMGQDQLTLSPDGKGFINVSGTSTRLSQYLPNLLPLEYTGRTDKGGTEVYDGDWMCILFGAFTKEGIPKPGDHTFPAHEAFRVYWNADKLQWFCGDKPLVERVKVLYVVGNIYENPKLKESEEQNGN